MGHFIESLESRTFLSVAPTVATLRMDGKTVLSDLTQLHNVGVANFKLIETDLRSADELKSSSRLVKALSIEGTAAYAVTSRVVHKTVTLISNDVNKVVAAAGHLSKKPTSVTLQAKLTAAENTLTTDAANRLSAINTAVLAQKTTNDANVVNILDANPGNTRLADDVHGSITTNTDNARNALTGNAGTALTTDVNQLILAFPT